jgi:signal transduction histidine kinase
LYRKNVELAHTNQTLSLLRAIDTLVLESQGGIKELCQGISQALIDSSDYLFAGIFTSEKAESESMQLLGYSLSATQDVDKNTINSLDMLSICTTSPWFIADAKMESVDTARISDSFLKQIFTHRLEIVEKLAKESKFGAVLLIKLFARQTLVGVLMVGVQEVSANITEVNNTLLQRLSEAIGLAVDNKLLFEENQRVLKKLEQSNKKLQELDEAKDEFISMASHQLRTPLTSVKGYVSMVLEGDAGKVSAKQKVLLRQSYTSAQRMVYLISDLLNVSRLRTGKFIIEPTAVNLPDVVGEELKQVEETAKSRNVKLSYIKPKNYPTLNLDDTKIRQVIMNFVDNAIYYTPAGGKVVVALNTTLKSAEFSVTDNGIGVPKAEQAHLFTKFYRAGNARVARPDGTGLGLFMAKKVIVASGGALIFKSTEGRGSTFGFTFPLKKTT